MKRIRKWRRDQIRDAVIRNGEALQKLYRARAGVDAKVWPYDCEYLDGNINNRERKRDRLLLKLKEG